MITKKRICILVLLLGASAGAGWWIFQAARPVQRGLTSKKKNEVQGASRNVASPTAQVAAKAREHTKMQTVPNVVGQRASIAQQLATLSDLELCHGEFYIAPNNWRDDIRPGVVYLQTPQANLPLERGRWMGAWSFIQAKPDQATVQTPDVVGLPVNEAQERLREMSLQVMNVQKSSDSGAVRPSTVIEQYPTAGQPVYERTSVFLRAL